MLNNKGNGLIGSISIGNIHDITHGDAILPLTESSVIVA